MAQQNSRRKAKTAPDPSTKAPSSSPAAMPPRGPLGGGNQAQPVRLGQPPAVIREGQGVRELPATHRYAAAVLAVFNAPEKRAGRFVSFHHAPLRAVSPGLAGWQDRQTLELAELGIFEVRHAPNHARRTLDPNYAGEVFDHRRRAWPRDDCGMLSPLGEWLLALSPEVEARLASMPPAEREDLAAVAAMLAELIENAEWASDPPLPKGRLAKALLWIDEQPCKGALPQELAEGLKIKPKTADKYLRYLGRDFNAGTRDSCRRKGLVLNEHGRRMAAMLRDTSTSAESAGEKAPMPMRQSRRKCGNLGAK